MQLLRHGSWRRICAEWTDSRQAAYAEYLKSHLRIILEWAINMFWSAVVWSNSQKQYATYNWSYWGKWWWAHTRHCWNKWLFMETRSCQRHHIMSGASADRSKIGLTSWCEWWGKELPRKRHGHEHLDHCKIGKRSHPEYSVLTTCCGRPCPGSHTADTKRRSFVSTPICPKFMQLSDFFKLLHI